MLEEVSPALGVRGVPDSASLPQEHIRDITDSLIEHCQEKSVKEDARVPLSNKKIIGIVCDLFGAGENILEGKALLLGCWVRELELLGRNLGCSWVFGAVPGLAGAP